MKNSEDRNTRILHKLETKIAMEKFEQENLVQNRKRDREYRHERGTYR